VANTLGYYNPEFYAQEALIQLEKALGMAARVHRGYDEERRSFGRGEYVNIRKPSNFTAQDAPSTAQDLDTETVQIQLAYWREVKFKLTDKELAFTSERIVDEHIRPAAYALADDVDQKLSLLYKDVPWFHDEAGSGLAVGDITGVRRVLFDNNVPVFDVGRLHLMVDGKSESELLALSAFAQQQGAGDAGVNTQMRGSLGMKYGLEVFANQNVQTHVPGVSADAAGTLGGDADPGDTTVNLANFETSGTFKKGDILVITGDTQKYVITADGSFSSGANAAVPVYPAIKTGASSGAVVTLDVEGTKTTINLAFHRNAFALVMAPLSEMGDGRGAQIASVTDPTTGLSLRSRIFYVGDTSTVYVARDVLYGVETLDGNLAARLRSA